MKRQLLLINLYFYQSRIQNKVFVSFNECLNRLKNFGSRFRRDINPLSHNAHKSFLIAHPHTSIIYPLDAISCLNSCFLSSWVALIPPLIIIIIWNNNLHCKLQGIRNINNELLWKRSCKGSRALWLNTCKKWMLIDGRAVLCKRP